MISAEKVTNIKVVELIKIYNFYFDHFFIRQSDSNIVRKFYISYSSINYKRDVKFVNNVTTTMVGDQMTKIKVVDFEKL
jgi:hypothetical protein